MDESETGTEDVNEAKRATLDTADVKTLAEEDAADAKLPAIDAGSSIGAGVPSSPPPAELLAQTFPQRLMEMLDNEVVPNAMWWAEDGKAFAMDLSKFADVLHRHFQATKYASFTRKLNKW